MLQYPINVNPQNRAIDASDTNWISYNFQGDFLSGVLYRITNYDTGSVEHESLVEEADKTPLAYNGNLVNKSISNVGLVNGRRYVLQMMMVQRTETGVAPLCDMPVIGGTIEKSAVGSTVIYVSKGITAIYPWGKSGDTYTPITVNNEIFNPMKIRIGNSLKTILQYDDNVEVDGEIYGKLTLDSGAYVTAGDTYQIYTNAIITPQYYFKTETAPTLSVFHNEYTNRMIVSGNYAQPQNTPLKYYILRLWWSNNSSFTDNQEVVTGGKVALVGDTGKMYSQKIWHEFWNPYYHDEYYSNASSFYKIECIVVTQNDYVSQKDVVFRVDTADYSGEIGNTLYDYELSWDSEKGRVLHTLRGYYSGGIGAVNGAFELFREDLVSGEVVKLQPHFSIWGQYATLTGFDLSASTKGKYRYTLKRFDENGGVIIPDIDEYYEGDYPFPGERPLPTSTISINENAYYITALYPQQDMDDIYYVNRDTDKNLEFELGDTWKFVGDISNTTVVNNLDTVTHVGYGRYINTTSTDVNYMSGTLSAMIGYVNCAEKKYVDDIALVRAWREFITQKIPFLLKSQKGDVWIVDIVDNPSVEYDESHSSIPTTFTFSWAESYNINDVTLKDAQRG